MYANDCAILSQSWQLDIISCRLTNAVTTLLKYFTTWKLWLNTHKTETIVFSKCHHPIHIQDTFVSWVLVVHYLGLVLDSELLFTWHLHIFLVLTQDLALTQSNKLIIYKLIIWSILTYAIPVWSSTCSSNYLRFQVIQSKMSLSHLLQKKLFFLR
jgi:hypothetical protein